MKRLPYFLLMLLIPMLSGCSFWGADESTRNPATWVHMTTTPEAEVKAAFVNIMRVCQTKEVDVFRKLILPKDVVEFDADEGERPGSYDTWMAAIASHPLKEYRIDATPDRVVFTADPKAPKLGDYAKPETTEVILVLDDHQWKIARSPRSDRSLSTLDSIDPNPPAARSRAKTSAQRTPKPSNR